MKLYLGFEDIPYVSRTSVTKSGKPRKRKLTASQEKYVQGKTTGQVAKDLEETYGIVQTFYEMEEDMMVELVEDAFGEEIENILMMKPMSKKALSEASTDEIENKFRESLSSQRFDGIISGVPTLASLRGVSHLQRHPYAKRGPRPSFIDTGLYRSSFRAWTTED
jgi:hypothetical protein